ncbi:MAG: ABC transporter substrate-binding protein [bacterium]|nr:ABC transporter substrate-binding protein [bacterium]
MGRYACSKKSALRHPALLLGLFLVAAACSGREEAAQSETEILIGVIAPVASDFLVSGPPTVEGAALAAKEINAGGGVDVGGRRRKIRLIVEDTADRPEIAVSKAYKLIGSDRVVALLGLPLSDSALVVAKVAEEHRVPMISTTSTNPETTRGRSFVFRVIFDDVVQGRVMAEFAYLDLEARRAGVLFDPGSAYSRGLTQEFRAAFRQLGGEVTEEGHTVDAVDAADRLLRIQESGADVLVMPMYPVLLSSLVRQARAVDITTPILGGETWGNLPEAERGGWGPAYFSDVWAPDSPSPGSREFIDAYRQEYGKPATSYAALAYDAVYLVARAIEIRGDSAPESIQAGLLSLTDFVGVTGAIRYEETGDPVRSAVIMRLAADGAAHLHRTIDP